MRRWRRAASRRSARCASDFVHLIAIEAVIAAQAVDLRPPEVRDDARFRRATAMYEGVRDAIRRSLDEDRLARTAISRRWRRG